MIEAFNKILPENGIVRKIYSDGYGY